MLEWLTGGIAKSVESIAKEWIDTPEEKAQANALMIKTLDPNGMMRRQISSTVSRLYTTYIIITMILVIIHSFGVGDIEGTKLAIKSLTDLFVPITSMFSAIVMASFGVNGINSSKGK